MQNTVGLIQQYKSKIVYPTEPDWNQFTTKLTARLAEFKPNIPTPVFHADYRVTLRKWLRVILVPQPTWVPSLAAIATVVIIIFQGALFSRASLSHTLFKYLDTKNAQQTSSNYQSTMEQRIAVTKYVFEKTNS